MQELEIELSQIKLTLKNSSSEVERLSSSNADLSAVLIFRTVFDHLCLKFHIFFLYDSLFFAGNFVNRKTKERL